MLTQTSAHPPVLIHRPVFAKLVALAERAAEDPSAVGALIAAVRDLEAGRASDEWGPEDAAVPPGEYVGDENGYFLRWNVSPEDMARPGMPAGRTFWPHAIQTIVVLDQPPVTAERMARLEALGIATRQSWTHWKDTPFTFYYVPDPQWLSIIREPTLDVRKTSGPPGGAWVVNGPDDRPVAWAGSSHDAEVLASSVNMALELSRDVSRSSGGAEFAREIAKSGVIGLIRHLRRSIEPEERWETEPSEALRAAGLELEKRLVDFMATARERRYAARYKGKAGV